MDLVLRALSEPHRRRILGLVRDRELSAGDIAERFQITRPAVSQHLAVLKEAGLVSERRQGTHRWYRVRPEALASVRLFVDELWSARLAGVTRALTTPGAGIGAERVSVEREVMLNAGRETVWKLLVQPKSATRWMGLSARFELKVGGRYKLEVLPERVAAGEFLKIDPPRRLVHTWGWDGETHGTVPPGSTVVSYGLTEVGHQTRLQLRHSGLPSIDTAGSHSRGWAHYLPRLVAVASGNTPGPDPWVADPARMQRELQPASWGHQTKASERKQS